MNFEADWLKKWSRYSPQAVAIKDADTGRELTYSSLFFLACRLATELSSRWAIKTGDRVAVLAGNELEYIPLFFATQRLGAILVPVNTRLTGREISHVLGDSGASLLVYQSQFRTLIDSADPKSVPDKKWQFDSTTANSGDQESLSSFLSAELTRFSQERMADRFRRDQLNWMSDFKGQHEDPCMILYTSGTTGAPKGALITNKMLHWNSINTSLRLNLQQSDTALSFLPFFHTGGWNVLLTPLLHRGGRTVLMRKFEAERVLNLCEQERVTILFGVPTTMNLMALSPVFESVDLSAVRYAIVGGEPMPIELIRTWQKRGIPIRQGYGLTEFGPGVFSLNEEDALRKIGSIGFANFYVDTRVVDNSGRDVGPEEIGELLLKGPVCTPGYWRNEAATAAAIQNGWLHTGDLVRFDDEGYFYVVGRKKDMFISGGENVYPAEIEQVLCAHPSIREAAVIGVQDERWGEVGKAFVVLKNDTPLTPLKADDVIAHCASQLAKFKIPKSVVFLSELPKGDSGKILKRALREL